MSEIVSYIRLFNKHIDKLDIDKTISDNLKLFTEKYYRKAYLKGKLNGINNNFKLYSEHIDNQKIILTEKKLNIFNEINIKVKIANHL